MIRTTLTLLAVLALAGPLAAQSTRDGAPVAQAGFGVSVAVNGDQVLVAEPNDVRNPGSIYVFGERDGAWTELARLTSDHAARGDLFGASLATAGDRLIVGATRQDAGRGGAYVFRREGAAWRQVASLAPAGATATDSFGMAVRNNFV